MPAARFRHRCSPNCTRTKTWRAAREVRRQGVSAPARGGDQGADGRWAFWPLKSARHAARTAGSRRVCRRRGRCRQKARYLATCSTQRHLAPSPAIWRSRPISGAPIADGFAAYMGLLRVGPDQHGVLRLAVPGAEDAAATKRSTCRATVPVLVDFSRPAHLRRTPAADRRLRRQTLQNQRLWPKEELCRKS